MRAIPVSHLPKCFLWWGLNDDRRSQGGRWSCHQALVQILSKAKGTLNHRLRRLETRGLIEVGRSSGGQADNAVLTSKERKSAVKFE